MPDPDDRELDRPDPIGGIAIFSFDSAGNPARVSENQRTVTVFSEDEA